jgi:hypothetical protein
VANYSTAGARHNHVPVGTIAGHEGIPATVRRHWDTVLLPAAQLRRDQLPALRQILDDAERDMAACEAEMAAGS